MSPAQRLLQALQDEETVLLERRFDALVEIQRRKDELLSAMEQVDDLATLEQIRAQASRNERLMSAALTAIRGLKTRFANMGQGQGTVGYARDGSMMGVENENPNRQV